MSAAASSGAAGGNAGEPGESDAEGSKPDLYSFTESSGHQVDELQDAYSVLEGNYWADDEEEKVVVGESTWNQVEEILENSSEEPEHAQAEKERSWKDKASSYLFENDSTYVKGGLAAGGTGLLSGALGYATAADFLVTGGAASIGWGIGSAVGKYVTDYFSSSDEEDDTVETESSVDHELDEYSGWEVEVVDLEEYGEALHEYRNQG
jgi:hypothetical protein